MEAADVPKMAPEASKPDEKNSAVVERCDRCFASAVALSARVRLIQAPGDARSPVLKLEAKLCEPCGSFVEAAILGAPCFSQGEGLYLPPRFKES
jgi:hypothetical protein